MLQHEHTPAEQTASPAERRVTPEELAKALATVEARKEQSTRETEGTIPIGEAVQQLGFDASPDEIWKEVQAQRQNREQTMRRLPKKARRRLWLALGVGLPVLIGMMAAIEGHIGAPSVTTITTDTAPLQVITSSTPQTVIKTFEEIPNNGTFYCDEDTARKLLQDSVTADNSLFVDNVLVTAGRPITSAQDNVSWTFTIHDGRLYVHGYTAPRSMKALELGHVPIYNSQIDDTGAGGLNYTQPITLAVGTFHMDSFTDGDFGGMTKKMVASGIHPDQHFGDTW